MHYTTIPILLSVKQIVAILADNGRDRFKIQHIQPRTNRISIGGGAGHASWCWRSNH
ncbi:hypothetical protein [Chamaesiphon sp. OTE_75_metabat_556]|uniref:hypothetical protein n=1 Tax=Chamaesiphon sp. OTE_75_metabat_556 TaxID=2964692 RepID=UPI00286CFE46|nr:hypothetical protein [Chamaesiphon sp. OTE_75_metabat_556]